MVKLNIKYGKRFEANRVKNTLSKKSWYDKHKYHVFLPKTDNELEELLRVKLEGLLG